MKSERQQERCKTEIVRQGKEASERLLFDLADITAKCKRLQRAFDDYAELLERGCVPAVIYDTAIGIGDRLQVRGLQFIAQMLAAMPDGNVIQGTPKYASLGEIEGSVGRNKLILTMPLPIKMHALKIRGAATLYVEELDEVLSGLDLRAIRDRGSYTISFTFYVPVCGSGVLDHDNYNIKPIIDTLCVHLHTTDSPHYIKLVLETVFDPHQIPHTTVTVEPAEQARSREKETDLP